MPPLIDSSKLDLPPDATIDGSSIKFKDPQGLDHHIIFEDYQMTNQEVNLYYKYTKLFLPDFPSMAELTFADLIKLNGLCTMAYFGYINATLKKKAELFGQKAIRVVIKVLYRKMVYEKKVPEKVFPIPITTDIIDEIAEFKRELHEILNDYSDLQNVINRLSSSGFRTLLLQFLKLYDEVSNLMPFDDQDGRKLHGILIQLLFCRLMTCEIHNDEARKVYSLMIQLHPDIDDLFSFIMRKNMHVKIKDPDKLPDVTKELNSFLGIQTLTDNDTFNLVVQSMMHYDKRLSGREHSIIYKNIGELSLTYLDVYFEDELKKKKGRDRSKTETSLIRTYQKVWEVAAITRSGFNIGWTNAHTHKLIDDYKRHDPGDLSLMYNFLPQDAKESLLTYCEQFKQKEDEFYYFWEANKSIRNNILS